MTTKTMSHGDLAEGIERLVRERHSVVCGLIRGSSTC